MALLYAASVCGQFLPDNDARDRSTASLYAGEVCGWYDVSRLRWHADSRFNENDARKWPRLGALSARPPHLPNASVCDGYGARRVRTRCAECPGEPFAREAWSVLQCSAGPLVPPPRASFVGVSSPPRDVLLVTSQHNNHGLFAQVERVLNQLHLAGARGLVPHVFLGRKAFASPTSCEVGENQYFDAAAGPNVWEYYFEPVSSYRGGNASLDGRPVRLLAVSDEDARRHAIWSDKDAVTSYFEFNRYDDQLHAVRTRVRRQGARLVNEWLRVRPPLLAEAAALLAPWRRRSSHLLGVHLRGTDKVTHPKVPLQKFFTYIDAYTKRHSDALIVLCTDDQSYHAAVIERYGAARVVSRGAGYATKNVVRDATIPPQRKGHDAVLDALLLAHTDFLLKGTSSLSEFALWYNPDLITEHLDLQIAGAAADAPAYRALVPTWAGGPREPASEGAGAASWAARQDARMRALGGGTAASPSTAAAARTPPPAVAEAIASGRFRAGGGGVGGSFRPSAPETGGDRVATVSGWRRRGGGRRGGGRGRGRRNGGAAAARVPEWPSQLPPLAPGLPREKSAPAAKWPPAKLIKAGRCDRGTRLMSLPECEAYARTTKRHFLGRGVEVNEYPGCVVWDPTGQAHVEYNEHPNAKGKTCESLGGRGECVCFQK